jgi:hypothetical protein
MVKVGGILELGAIPIELSQPSERRYTGQPTAQTRR